MTVMRAYIKQPGDKRASAFADLILQHGMDFHFFADFYAMVHDTATDLGALVRFKEVRV